MYLINSVKDIYGCKSLVVFILVGIKKVERGYYNNLNLCCYVVEEQHQR